MGLLKWFMVALATCATLATCVTHAARDKSVELLVAFLLRRRKTLPGPTPASTVQPSQIDSQVNDPYLNDSLYELYKPPGIPSMQVLFFHGFQLGDYTDAHLSTWKSGDDSTLWPKTWLAQEFPGAHILTVSYNTRFKKPGGGANMDLFLIGENLMSDLLQANIGQEYRCPVVLIGHSFGGLVMKQLCWYASQKGRSEHSRFLENVRGLFFYATPHHGIRDEKLAASFVSPGPLLEYVKMLSSPMARLNDHFQDLCKDHKDWRIAGLGETLPIKRGVFGESVVVSEGSARYGNDFRMVHDVNHVSICRPMQKTSTSFNTLVRFLRSISSNSMIEELPENFQHFSKEIIGIDSVLEEVKGKLQKVSSLGLTGMGGIGKSTLAMKLFNDQQRSYEYTCFLKDVKNITGSVNDEVQKQMHNWRKPIEKKDSLGFLRGKRLLLILDDVASEERDLGIVRILRNGIQVHESSRFIATSRDSEVLNQLDEVYRVPFLSTQSSKQLFLTYAFRTSVPGAAALQKCVDDMVGKCGGLPLTLEVMGKYLYKKSISIWEQAITALDKAIDVAGFDGKLWTTLKLSYDGLDKVEQGIFLDAATIFYKQELAETKLAWSIAAEGLQEMRWQNLLGLSLVWEVPDEVNSDVVYIGMHEQLLRLGRRIASTPGENGRRVWGEEGWDMFASKNYNVDDIKDIVALSLWPVSSQGYLDLPGTTLKTMKNLRYMQLAATHIGPMDGTPLPSTLVSLTLQNVTFSDLRFNPSEKNRLTVLNLCRCHTLRTLPASFGELSSLQKLLIWGCPQLESLPRALGNLSALQHLVLSFCPVSAMPDSFGCLVRLQTLLIVNYEFTELPDTFGNLSALKNLAICSCHTLRQLPNTFGNLSALEHLRLNECVSLSALPDSVGCLVRLKTLKLEKLLIRELPQTFGNLVALELLEMTSCVDLSQLPKTFGNLVALEHLQIGACSELTALPDSFGRLGRLKMLEITYCGLRELPHTFLELQGLEQLTLVQPLQIIPNLENLSSLKTFQLEITGGGAVFSKLPNCLRGMIMAPEGNNRRKFYKFDVVGGFPWWLHQRSCSRKGKDSRSEWCCMWRFLNLQVLSERLKLTKVSVLKLSGSGI